MTWKLSLIIIGLALGFNCAAMAAEETQTYHNNEIGFSITLPDAWSVKQTKVLDASEAILSQSDKQSDVIEFSQDHGIAEKQVFAATDNDKSQVKVTLWRLGDIRSHLDTGHKFLRGVKYILDDIAHLPATFERQSAVMIDGIKFSHLVVTIKKGSSMVKEHWYATMHGDCALTFVTNAVNPVEDQEVIQIIRSIDF